MRRSLPILFSVSLLLLLCSATCNKPLVCTGNCYELAIDGKAINALTGAPAPEVPFTLFRRATGSLFNVRRKVIDFQSDAQGNIHSTASIDTSALRNQYYFYAEMEENASWVMPGTDYFVLYNITQSPFQNLQPKVYPRANLTLKLKRNVPGDFTFFQVACYYDRSAQTYPWSVLSPKDITENSKLYPTAAGIWTYVEVTRKDSLGNIKFTRDSVQLQLGQSQALSINY
jgi:hypothetical protein